MTNLEEMMIELDVDENVQVKETRRKRRRRKTTRRPILPGSDFDLVRLRNQLSMGHAPRRASRSAGMGQRIWAAAVERNNHAHQPSTTTKGLRWTVLALSLIHI